MARHIAPNALVHAIRNLPGVRQVKIWNAANTTADYGLSLLAEVTDQNLRVTEGSNPALIGDALVAMVVEAESNGRDWATEDILVWFAEQVYEIAVTPRSPHYYVINLVTRQALPDWTRNPATADIWAAEMGVGWRAVVLTREQVSEVFNSESGFRTH